MDIINQLARRLPKNKWFDSKNLPLYIFLLIVLAVCWSGMKTIQTNYELQRQINGLKQQNAVIQLQNENTKLQNTYYQTEQYLDLSARQNLGLAAPGEKVLLVPKSTALKYVDQSLSPTPTNASSSESGYIQNIKAWRDFLLGHNISN